MMIRVAGRVSEDLVINRDLSVAGHTAGGRGGHLANLVVHYAY